MAREMKKGCCEALRILFQSSLERDSAFAQQDRRCEYVHPHSRTRTIVSSICAALTYEPHQSHVQKAGSEETYEYEIRVIR